MQYNIIYSDYNKQIWVLILFPLLLISPLVAILLAIKNLDGIIILISVFAWMAIMIITLLYIVNKQLMVPAQLTITKSGLDIQLEKHSWFYRFQTVSIQFSQVKSITDDEDVQQNYRKFFTIKTSNPSRKIMLLAPKKQRADETAECTIAIMDAIQNYNNSVPGVEGPIKQGSFYGGRFATAITILFAVVILLMIGLMIADPDSVQWYKIVAVMSFSVMWFANYFNARKKRREKAGL